LLRQLPSGRVADMGAGGIAKLDCLLPTRFRLRRFGGHIAGMRAAPDRAAIYAIYAVYVPPMPSAGAGERASASSQYRREPGPKPTRHDFAPMRSLALLSLS
jgi:hypothetical protein